MSCVSALVNILGYLFCNRTQTLLIKCVVQYVQPSVHQPRRLNVVSVRIQVDQTVPGAVKKDFLPPQFRVVYLIRNEVQHKTDVVSHLR